MSFLLCTIHPARDTSSCMLSFVSPNEKLRSRNVFCWLMGLLASDGSPGMSAVIGFFIVQEDGKGRSDPWPGAGHRVSAPTTLVGGGACKTAGREGRQRLAVLFWLLPQ